MATTTNFEFNSVIDSITHQFGTELRGKRIAVWGLTSETNIHIACDSRAMSVIDWLVDCGAQVSVHAPNVFCEPKGDSEGSLEFVRKHWDALRGADALVMLSDQYADADAGQLHWHLRSPVIIDSKNCLGQDALKYGSFTYYGVEDQRPMNESSLSGTEADTSERTSYPVLAAA